MLRDGGHLLVATIARTDSPEIHPYWPRPATSFDAEDAPGLVRRAFKTVTVHHWDVPLVRLPSATAVRDYFLTRQAPARVADSPARELPVPLTVTKRGALIHAVR